MPGVSDIFVMVPCGTYHGLWIEFKREDKKNKPTEAQRQFMSRALVKGYAVGVCYNLEEGINLTKAYLCGGYNTLYVNDVDTLKLYQDFMERGRYA